MRNAYDKSCTEYPNTRLIFSKRLLRESYSLQFNVEKYDWARQATGHSITQRLHFAWWITKATNTHSEYVILSVFAGKQWLRERASLSRSAWLPFLFKHIYIVIQVLEIWIAIDFVDKQRTDTVYSLFLLVNHLFYFVFIWCCTKLYGCVDEWTALLLYPVVRLVVVRLIYFSTSLHFIIFVFLNMNNLIYMKQGVA
jgi:hypothetical protein